MTYLPWRIAPYCCCECRVERVLSKPLEYVHWGDYEHRERVL